MFNNNLPNTSHFLPKKNKTQVRTITKEITRISFYEYLLLWALFLLMGSSLFAQNEYHSYVTDRKFSGPEELQGYRFCPNEIGFTDGEKEGIYPGEVCFLVTPNYLYVQGGDYEGSYSINSTTSESYGFLMSFMDAQNPSKQGNLKIYLNAKNQVDVLVFKQSRQEEQVVFFNAMIPDATNFNENEYFTDKGELTLTDLDELWGKSVSPFHILTQQGAQKRVRMKDSLSIEFVRTVDTTGKKDKTKYEVHLKYYDYESVDGETLSNQEDKVFVITSSNTRKTGSLNPEQRYSFDLEAKNSSVQVISVFTNAEKTVSIVQIGKDRYLMRGY